MNQPAVFDASSVETLSAVFIARPTHILLTAEDQDVSRMPVEISEGRLGSVIISTQPLEEELRGPSHLTFVNGDTTLAIMFLDKKVVFPKGERIAFKVSSPHVEIV